VPADTDDETAEAKALIATLRQIQRGQCHDCGQPYASPDALFSIALGFKESPRCLTCLARGLGRDAVDLREQLIDFIRRKDCYRQAWELIPHDDAAFRASAISPAGAPSPAAPPPGSNNSASAEWDAGDLGCGELVLSLRNRLTALSSGSILRLIAHDPAAPEDLPAWCRMTGHTLVGAEHPIYLIRRS
jgi:tRNA 2-thiouridine synthesizing protein A